MNNSRGRKTKSSDKLQLSLFFDFVSQSYDDNCFLENLVFADINNIRKTVPQLYPDQQEDVLKAECRFKEGKGILFTNGTGTGKTYTGLGIIKRFYLNGNKNILIVVPTDTKVKDWIEDAKNLSLTINQLTDIKTNGEEIVITTYANFYQNKALLEREFDLIVYDECHYLTQNEQGNQTVYFEAHRNVANLPSTARNKALDFLPVKPAAPEYPQRPEYSDPEYRSKMKIFDNQMEQYRRNYSDFELSLKDWNQRFDDETKRIYNQTKVVMLSASPFAYHKSCILGDGTLWEINEKLIPDEDSYRGYNVPSGMEEFLTTHFGYRMRYNKATKAETGVDVNFLERMFYENMVEKGVISGRQLVVDTDYSREFVTISSELGFQINEGMKLFHSYGDEFSEKYKYLKERVHRKWNYLYISQLLEGLKAVNVIERVRKHLELGRKVVIFHGYNNALPSHPFRFNAYSLLNADDRENSHVIEQLQKEIRLFEWTRRNKYPVCAGTN